MNRLIKTRNVEGEKYALAIPTDGPLMIIQTYHNIEQLETGYKDWHTFASKQKITKPVPIESLDKEGHCKILDDLF